MVVLLAKIKKENLASCIKKFERKIFPKILAKAIKCRN